MYSKNPSNNIGALYKADNLGLVPAAQSAVSRQGTALAPNTWGSGTLVGLTGAATGTPTALSVTYGLETRDASTAPAGPWVALNDADGNPVEVEVTTASTIAEVDFDLQYVPEGHTEMRVTETVAFTGGTTPTVLSGAVLVLGGASSLPV